MLSGSSAIKLAAAVSAAAVFTASGCGKLPEVNLSVWNSPASADVVEEMTREFIKKYENDAVINITVSAESEASCKETVLADPHSAADIFAFADDQLDEMLSAGALLEITDNADAVIDANGGISSGAAASAMRGGKLYAFPETAGNEYFLIYNAEYFTDEDVRSFDRILEISAANGKKTAMDFSSGWYIYSFFKSAGLDVRRSPDGVSNICSWNSTDGKYKGTDVAEAMLKIASSDGFISCENDDLIKGLQNGSVIACISGAWNDAVFSEAFGENYRATILPEYTIAGDSVQMCSFAGYKLLGISAYTDEPEWSMRLAEWLTNEDNQLKRFRATGECPSNTAAAASDEVKASVTAKAIAMQSEFAYTQDVGDSFWDPARIFGITIAGRNADNADLQELLDTMTAGITGENK